MRWSPRDLPAPGETTLAHADSSVSEITGYFTFTRPVFVGSLTFVTVPMTNCRLFRNEALRAETS